MGEMDPKDFFGWILAVCRAFLDMSQWDAAYMTRQMDRFGSMDEATEAVWSHLATKRPEATT